MKNQQQENNLNNAQNALKKINLITEQLKLKAEFSDELGNLGNLQQIAKKAEQEIQNAKNQNQ